MVTTKEANLDLSFSRVYNNSTTLEILDGLRQNATRHATTRLLTPDELVRINNYVEAHRNRDGSPDADPIPVLPGICSIQVDPDLVLEFYSGRSGQATIAYNRQECKGIFGRYPEGTVSVHYQPPTIT